MCTASRFTAMYTSHPVRKQLAVRAIGRMKYDALVEDLNQFSIYQECVDVAIMIEQYDKCLSDLLDKHDPKKNMYVVDRLVNEWMTNNIISLIVIRRTN